MKISFLNQQDKFPVTKKLRTLMETAAKTSLRYMQFRTDVEISVMLTDNEGIRALNAMHRGIDRTTDVLSFPMYEYDEDGAIIEEYAEYGDEGDLCLGDIVISLERAAEQAEEYGHSFEREVGFLTVHSMLHLLGYDHENGGLEAMRMREKEEAVLTQLGLPRTVSYTE